MVEREATPINDVFHALGDATRRRMLRDLAAGERTVSELAAPHPISLAAAHDELSFYARFWTDHTDTLERLLREEDAPTEPNEPPET